MDRGQCLRQRQRVLRGGFGAWQATGAVADAGSNLALIVMLFQGGAVLVLFRLMLGASLMLSGAKPALPT